MNRVAVIFRRLGPYHHARLKAAGRVLEVIGIEMSGCDTVYAWDQVQGAEGFQRVVLFPDQELESMPAATLAERLTQALTDANPQTVVVSGWAELESFAALLWCATRRVPAVVMSESTAWDEKRSGWKEWVKGRVIGLCSTALAGGTPHAEYLVTLGMLRERISLGYDAVDNDCFAQHAEEIRAQRSEIGSPQVSSLRSQPSPPPLPRTPFFLASARFVAKKNLPRLLEAFARYRELASSSALRTPHSARWSLVLLGDGPLRPALESQVSGLKLEDCVTMPGFKQYDELPAYYARAGAFIHASTTEQWGLVVNEAMASGLPVLVSNRCGCAQDLVQEGVNGFTFDPCNLEQMAQLMLKISAFNFPLSEFGAASQRIISAWGPDRFAAGLSQAVNAALNVPPPRASLLDRLLLKLLLLR